MMRPGAGRPKLSTVDPKDIPTSETGGKKAVKIEELHALDPQALLELARVAGWGWRKHGERHNFAKGFPWSDRKSVV